MKAILLAPTPPPTGGIASWTVRMLGAHLKNNWSLEVVDEKAIGNRQGFNKAGRRNFVDETRRCISIWSNLNKAIRDSEVAVVHSCIPSVTFAMMREYICACLAQKKGKRFIIHFRCTVPNTTKGRIGKYVLKKLCNRSDLIITLNEQSSRYLEGITKTKIKLIPNFICESELSNDYEVRDSLNTVVYVGGLVERKGIFDCLEIAKRMPDITFRFVGEGNEIFKQKATTDNLSNVVFTGRKDRNGVLDELRKADAFLFMTFFRGEGFSNSLCEAMAVGLPCVVTDWAANRDMIGEKGGYVVAVNDITGAVNALLNMKDKDIRLAMSQANKEKVEKEYIDSVVIDQYIDAYESLI